MHLSKVNEALSHKIVSGSDHLWSCWGQARFLDYESEFGNASIIFDVNTQVVYCAEVTDKEYAHKPYRWLNPEYKQEYYDEAQAQGVDPDQAWDQVKWTDLDVEEDWLEKASAIFNGEDFDTRIKVPIDLSKEELFVLMSIAHERDITLNDLVVDLLEKACEKHANATSI